MLVLTVGLFSYLDLRYICALSVRSHEAPYIRTLENIGYLSIPEMLSGKMDGCFDIIKDYGNLWEKLLSGRGEGKFRTSKFIETAQLTLLYNSKPNCMAASARLPCVLMPIDVRKNGRKKRLVAEFAFCNKPFVYMHV